MEIEAIRAQVTKAVSQTMGLPVEEIDESSSPDTIESWDSLNHMNLILALEEEFGVQFTDEQIMEMLDVKLIVSTLNEFFQ